MVRKTNTFDSFPEQLFAVDSRADDRPNGSERLTNSNMDCWQSEKRENK